MVKKLIRVDRKVLMGGELAFDLVPSKNSVLIETIDLSGPSL